MNDYIIFRQEEFSFCALNGELFVNKFFDKLKIETLDHIMSKLKTFEPNYFLHADLTQGKTKIIKLIIQKTDLFLDWDLSNILFFSYELNINKIKKVIERFP